MVAPRAVVGTTPLPTRFQNYVDCCPVAAKNRLPLTLHLEYEAAPAEVVAPARLGLRGVKRAVKGAKKVVAAAMEETRVAGMAEVEREAARAGAAREAAREAAAAEVEENPRSALHSRKNPFRVHRGRTSHRTSRG